MQVLRMPRLACPLAPVITASPTQQQQHHQSFSRRNIMPLMMRRRFIHLRSPMEQSRRRGYKTIRNRRRHRLCPRHPHRKAQDVVDNQLCIHHHPIPRRFPTGPINRATFFPLKFCTNHQRVVPVSDASTRRTAVSIRPALSPWRPMPPSKGSILPKPMTTRSNN